MSDAAVPEPVAHVLAGLDDHDADGAAAAFAPDGTFHEVPYEEVFAGETVRDYFAEELFVSFPDYRIVEREAVTTDEWATVLRWTFSATHEGPVGPFEPTGNAVSLPIVSVVTVGEEGVDSWRNFYDTGTLEAQLQ